MAESQYEFEKFFNREGFNRSLSHFQAVSSLLEDFEDGINLADILNALLAEKEIVQEQLNPILYALLIDKYGYISDTHNMTATLEDFEHIKAECPTWNAVDLVVAYHHPDLGITLLNPKNPAPWDAVQNVRKNELVTIYAGAFDDEVSEKTAAKAIETLIRFLEGKKTKSPAVLLKGEYEYQAYEEEAGDDSDDESERERPRRRAPARASADDEEYDDDDDYDEDTDDADDESDKAPAPAPAPAAPAAPSGNRRMTPMYSVPVTNELFHNGNVEAWKKIIQSYQLKYPDNDVLVFYDGERIHDINTLFKWGKVKHGSSILFAIVGEEIKDAAKLQRYFRQGASPQFEAFLRVPVNTVLKLF